MVYNGSVVKSFDAFMEKEKIIKMFEGIGLSENEAKVYFAMLSIGPSTAQKISRSSGLKRTAIYPVVEALKNEGLARIEMEGLKQKFAAEDPKKLEAVIDERNRIFKQKVPLLSSLFVSDESASTVKCYQGLKAIKGVYDDLLRDIKSGDYYYSIADVEKWQGHDEKFFMGHVEDRSKLDVKTRLIFHDSEKARWRKQYEKNFNELVKILPVDKKLNTDIVVTPQRVVIFQL